jgi:4-hydroxy-L-threonine phosphate dehydrogenase PdxA
MKASLPLVGITMGDPVGVGPEIIPKALADPRVLRCCRPVIYGNATRLMTGAATTGVRMRMVAAIAMAADQARWQNHQFNP